MKQRKLLITVLLFALLTTNVIFMMMNNNRVISSDRENNPLADDNIISYGKIQNQIDNKRDAYSGGELISLSGNLNYDNSSEVSLGYEWFLPCQLVTAKIKLGPSNYITLESPEGGSATNITTGTDTNGNLIDDETSPSLNDPSAGRYNITAVIPERSEWEGLGLSSGNTTVVVQYGGNTSAGITGWDDLIEDIVLSESLVVNLGSFSLDPLQQGESTTVTAVAQYEGGSPVEGIQLNHTLYDDQGNPLDPGTVGISITTTPLDEITDSGGTVDYTIQTTYPTTPQQVYELRVSAYHAATDIYAHDANTFTVDNNDKSAEMVYENTEYQGGHANSDDITILSTIRQGYNVTLTVKTQFQNGTGINNAPINYELRERATGSPISPSSYSIDLQPVSGTNFTDSSGLWQIKFTTIYFATPEMDYSLYISSDLSGLGLEDPPDYLITAAVSFNYNITVNNMYDRLSITSNGGITHTEEVRLSDVETILPMKVDIENGTNLGTFYNPSDIPQVPLHVNLTDISGNFGTYPGVNVSVRSYNGVTYEAATIMDGWYLTNQDGLFEVVVQCSWPELYDKYTFKVNISAELSWTHLDSKFTFIQDETGTTNKSSTLTDPFTFDPHYGIGKLALVSVEGGIESAGNIKIRPDEQINVTYLVYYYNESTTSNVPLADIWVTLQFENPVLGLYWNSYNTPTGTPNWYKTNSSGYITFNITAVYGEAPEVAGGVVVDLNVTADFYTGNPHPFIIGEQNPANSDYPNANYALFNQSWSYIQNGLTVDPQYNVFTISYTGSNATISDKIRPGDSVSLTFLVVNSTNDPYPNIPVNITFYSSQYTASLVSIQNTTDLNGYVTFYVATTFDLSIKEFILQFNVTADFSPGIGYSWDVGERAFAGGPRSQSSVSTLDTVLELATITVDPMERIVEIVSAPGYPEPSLIQQTESTILAYLVRYQSGGQNAADGVAGQPIAGITVTINNTHITQFNASVNSTTAVTNGFGIAYFNITTTGTTVQDQPYQVTATADLENDTGLYDILAEFVNGTVFVSGNTTYSTGVSAQFTVHNSRQIVTEIQRTFDESGSLISAVAPWKINRGGAVEVEATYKEAYPDNSPRVGETLTIVLNVDGTTNITSDDELVVSGSTTTDSQGKILINISIPTTYGGGTTLPVKDMQIIIHDPIELDEEQIVDIFSIRTEITLTNTGIVPAIGNRAYITENVTLSGTLVDDLGDAILPNNGIHDTVYAELLGQLTLTQKNSSSVFGAPQTVILDTDQNTFTTDMQVHADVVESTVLAELNVSATDHFVNLNYNYIVEVFQSVVFNQLELQVGTDGPYPIVPGILQYNSPDGNGIIDLVLQDNHGRSLADRSVVLYWNQTQYIDNTTGTGSLSFSDLAVPDNVYVAPFDCNISALINNSIMQLTSFQVERAVSDIYNPSVSITNSVTTNIDGNITTIMVSVYDDYAVRSAVNTSSGLIYIDGAEYALTFVGMSGPNYEFAYNWSTSLENLPNTGPYNITVKVFDNAGNNGIDEVDFTLDRNAPTITLLNPAQEYVYGSTDFEFSFVDNENSINAITARFNVNGGTNDTFTTDFVYTLDTTGLGTFTIGVQIKDNAGNLAYQEYSFTVDEVKPNLAIGSLIENEFYGQSINFTVSSSDIGIGINNNSLILIDNNDTLTQGNQYTVNNRIKSQGFIIWNITWNLPTSTSEDHNLTVIVSDIAGNDNQTTISLRIDVVAPVLNIQGLEAGTVFGDEVTFSVGIVEIGSGIDVDTFQIIDRDDKEITNMDISRVGTTWQITWDTSDVKVRNRRLRISISDNIGNQGSENVLVVIDVIQSQIRVLYSDNDVTAQRLPSNSTTATSLTGNITIRITISDDYNNNPSFGLDEGTFSVYLDGELVEFTTYEIDTNNFEIAFNLHSRDFESLTTTHTLEIVATDNAGNQANFVGTLKIYNSHIIGLDTIIFAGIAGLVAIGIGVIVAYAYEKYAYEYY